MRTDCLGDCVYGMETSTGKITDDFQVKTGRRKWCYIYGNQEIRVKHVFLGRIFKWVECFLEM